jgi:hypothetical protein
MGLKRKKKTILVGKPQENREFERKILAYIGKWFLKYIC